MSRVFALALVLAEINFSCVPTTACGEGDDEQSCHEPTDEGEPDEGEPDEGEPDEGEPDELPLPDLGG